MRLAIVTTSYNRRHCLAELRSSLLQQTDRDFAWIVVDDGSTDGTENAVNEWMNDDMRFPMIFLRIPNGGKSRALNRVFDTVHDIDLYIIVDSDDRLLPDAVHTIRMHADRDIGDSCIGGLFFRYRGVDGDILGSSQGRRLRTTPEILSRYQHDARFKKEDGCYAYFRRAVERFHYPEYEGENYIGPIVLQLMMSTAYAIHFTNEVVGMAEYLPGGLTLSGRQLRLRNPLGMIHYCSLLQARQAPLRTRLLYGVMAQAYADVSGKSSEELEKAGIPPRSLSLWLRPFGWLLARWWEAGA